MFINRTLNLDIVLERKSVFLFGPRQTGKSTLLKEIYKDAFYIDLNRRSLFQEYSRNLNLFIERVTYVYKHEEKRLVVIDEVQKLPDLLNEVHILIEEYKDLRFILTGSSARKLKRSDANLLGGRASWFILHPFTYREIGKVEYEKNFLRIINHGKLPSIYFSKNPWEDLKDYVGLYLEEEIKSELANRSLSGFTSFFDKVALTNAEQINFTKLGDDIQVGARKVKEYYQILEDTMIGSLLPAFTKTKKRKAMASAKFYLFDTGLTNCLLNQESVSAKTKDFGNLLEQLVYTELKAFCDYNKMKDNLFYWRSTSQMEVDFLLKTSKGEWIGIEVKSTNNPSRSDEKGLLALAEDITLSKKIIVCMGNSPKVTDSGVMVLPVFDFLAKLWESSL